jgi:hypothetical protein
MSSLNETLKKLFSLFHFTYHKELIHTGSIHAFQCSTKHLNDINNKTRENVIGAIINQKMPEDYFIIWKWERLKRAIYQYLEQLNDSRPYVKVECIHKAGRKYNYDFEIRFDYDDQTQQTFNIELKFNSSSVENTPQFVSPMKPSQYMSNSYEEYFYDHYLPLLSTASGIPLPSKEEYLKHIHSTKPKCMKPFQDLYYQGCEYSSKFTKKEEDIQFYHLSKKLSNESIASFIDKTELRIDLLSSYLLNTQRNKIYMLYYNHNFLLQKANMDDYVLESVSKHVNRYDCRSKSGKVIQILLRWKNGNGIAFPAFQIS